MPKAISGPPTIQKAAWCSVDIIGLRPSWILIWVLALPPMSLWNFASKSLPTRESNCTLCKYTSLCPNSMHPSLRATWALSWVSAGVQSHITLQRKIWPRRGQREKAVVLPDHFLLLQIFQKHMTQAVERACKGGALRFKLHQLQVNLPLLGAYSFSHSQMASESGGWFLMQLLGSNVISDSNVGKIHSIMFQTRS